MRSCLAFLLALGLNGGVATAAETVWQASEANGDKPGIGFRIVKGTCGLTGTAYLLHPDHPHDFSKGVARKMRVTHATAREMKFQIDWGDGKKYSCRFRFDADLDSKPVRGTLTEENSPGVPRVYTFKPVQRK